MNSQSATETDVTGSNRESGTFNDPWEALDESFEHRETWLLSYIDILTLFLTLFVVLLILQPDDESPPIEADPGEYEQFSPQQFERRSRPHTEATRVESPQASGSAATGADSPFANDAAMDILAAYTPTTFVAPADDTAAPQTDLPTPDMQAVDDQSATEPPRLDLSTNDPPAAENLSDDTPPEPDPPSNEASAADDQSAAARLRRLDLTTSYAQTADSQEVTVLPEPDLVANNTSVAATRNPGAPPQPDLPAIDRPVAGQSSDEDFSNRPDPTNTTSVVSVDEPASAPPPGPSLGSLPVSVQGDNDPLQRFMTELTQAQLEKKVKVSLLAEGVYLEVRDNVLFALGSAELKAEGEHLLNELAKIFQNHRGIVSVEGHTDDQPISNARFPSNWELSTGRATTVTRYLVGKGLDPARLRAVGYADTRPLESNATAAGRSRNRRVALIVNRRED